MVCDESVESNVAKKIIIIVKLFVITAVSPVNKVTVTFDVTVTFYFTAFLPNLRLREFFA
jgi:hypothetical protein